jgi:glucokinase
MDIQWIKPDLEAETLIFAGDVGGTNTSLALVGRKNRSFYVMGKFLFKTRELSSLTDAALAARREIQAKLPASRIDRCCISAAGPVEGNRCVMTNTSWDIRGGDIEAVLDARTAVINDFLGISYGIPLLDPADPAQITVIPHTDGTAGSPRGNVRAVVGAGTGLGVGYLIEDHGRYIACPSEGGHTDFAGFDPESRELAEFIERRVDMVPEAEFFVSGQGILNIFAFYSEKKRPHSAGAAALFDRIAAAPDADKPALIAEAAEREPLFADMMDLFTRCYGRFASNTAAAFLPAAGFYIAGGIAMKNEARFLKSGGFMEVFEMSYRPVIREFLKSVPVYLVKDYGISLLGAANAAYSLL